jgi:putative SOS response-associated peptidase YedK
MPIIVDKNNYLDWLKPNYPLDKIKDLLIPSHSPSWEITLVSPRVNSVNFDAPECIKSLQ